MGVAEQEMQRLINIPQLMKHINYQTSIAVSAFLFLDSSL